MQMSIFRAFKQSPACESGSGQERGSHSKAQLKRAFDMVQAELRGQEGTMQHPKTSNNGKPSSPVFIFYCCRNKLPKIQWPKMIPAYYLTVIQLRSLVTLLLSWALSLVSQGWRQGVCRPVFLSGSSGYEPASRFIQVVGRVQFLAGVGLRAVSLLTDNCGQSLLPGPSISEPTLNPSHTWSVSGLFYWGIYPIPAGESSVFHF